MKNVIIGGILVLCIIICIYCQIEDIREPLTQPEYSLADYPNILYSRNPNNQENIHALAGYPIPESRTEHKYLLFDNTVAIGGFPFMSPSHFSSSSSSSNAGYSPLVGPGSNKNIHFSNNSMADNTPTNTTLYPSRGPTTTPSPKPTVPFMTYNPR